MDALEIFKQILRATDPLIELNRCLLRCIDGAVENASKREKPSSMLSVFRMENDKWRSMTRRLKQMCDIDGSKYENDFIDRLAVSYPEIYTVCVHNRVFIGHTPTMEQMNIMNRAENTLQSDRQPRVALTMYRRTM